LSLPELAGFLASSLFVISNLPMLFKVFKTKNLKSYSLLHIGMANVGNLIYWLYIINLPFGSIWFLHGFNTGVTLIMLVWYLRYNLNIKRKSSSKNPERN